MYLLFDIGGTNMRVGVSSNGTVLDQVKIVPTPPVFEDGVAKLQQVADELAPGEKIAGVAGGIAGPLDKGKTMLIASPHISGWIEKPFKQELEKTFGCQVVLENDTAIEGLGEATKGTGIGRSIVAYLTLGTGVGSVRIVDGNIDRNALGFESGHQIVVLDGNLCDCGGKGHLETYVGGSYIEKIYHQKAENIKDEKVWNEIAKYLAIGVYNTIVFWSPDVVILGGSVMKSLPLELVTKHLQEQLKIFPQTPEVVLATLGDNAGLLGALTLLSS